MAQFLIPILPKLKQTNDNNNKYPTHSLQQTSPSPLNSQQNHKIPNSIPHLNPAQTLFLLHKRLQTTHKQQLNNPNSQNPPPPTREETQKSQQPRLPSPVASAHTSLFFLSNQPKIASNNNSKRTHCPSRFLFSFTQVVPQRKSCQNRRNQSAAKPACNRLSTPVSSPEFSGISVEILKQVISFLHPLDQS